MQWLSEGVCWAEFVLSVCVCVCVCVEVKAPTPAPNERGHHLESVPVNLVEHGHARVTELHLNE